MNTTQELYGRPVLPSLKVTLTEQVHDILVEEIQNGRWALGERLPSISDVARMSRLTRSPVQRAFDMLAAEGYIRQEDRRGSYLTSLLPEGRQPVGAIGIVMMTQSTFNNIDQRPHVPYLMHHIIEEAARRNYLTEVVCLKEGDDWSALNSPQGPFSDRVKGIISLHPFACEDFQELPADRIPLVFLGSRVPRSLPCASGHNWLGGYRLTREVLKQGHKRIILCARAEEPSYGTLQAIEGHTAAMLEAGLSVNTEAIEDSTRLRPHVLADYRDYLLKHADATAVISLCEPVALSIVNVAEMLGVRLPEDLSLVSSGNVPLNAGQPSKQITSIEYCLQALLDAGFTMLEGLMRTGHADVSQLLTQPVWLPGETLGAPRARLSLHDLFSGPPAGDRNGRLEMAEI